MNIPQITAVRLTNQLNIQQKNKQQNLFGLRITAPITEDTVSFSATPKKLVSRTNGISLDTARRVHKAANPMQEKVRAFLFDLFGDLVATDANPKNPIYAIKDRVKSPRSIKEKSATRQYNSKNEVLDFMTDLNGAKIVMRDGRKKTVEMVLKRFIEPIQKGRIELLQIENKRPLPTENYKRVKKEQYDYASIDLLEDLRYAQEDRWDSMFLKEPRTVDTNYNDLTDTNYMAIHFLFKFPGAPRPFELVILGKDVNDLKDLDDLLFKILNNKEVDGQYKPIVRTVEPLNKLENEHALEKFNKYRGDAFIFQREKEPTSYIEETIRPYFLPLRYDLPSTLDLNKLYEVMMKCDGIDINSPSNKKAIQKQVKKVAKNQKESKATKTK